MSDLSLLNSYSILLEHQVGEWPEDLVEIKWLIGETIAKYKTLLKSESSHRLGIIQGVLWAHKIIGNPFEINRTPPGDPKKPIQEIRFTNNVVFVQDVLFLGNVIIQGTLTTVAAEIIDNEKEWRENHDDPTIA